MAQKQARLREPTMKKDGVAAGAEAIQPNIKIPNVAPKREAIGILNATLMKRAFRMVQSGSGAEVVVLSHRGGGKNAVT